jgi:hypothetical protein
MECKFINKVKSCLKIKCKTGYLIAGNGVDISNTKSKSKYIISVIGEGIKRIKIPYALNPQKLFLISFMEPGNLLLQIKVSAFDKFSGKSNAGIYNYSFSLYEGVVSQCESCDDLNFSDSDMVLAYVIISNTINFLVSGILGSVVTVDIITTPTGYITIDQWY